MRPYLTHKAIEITHAITTAMSDVFKADEAEESAEDEDELRSRLNRLVEGLQLDWTDLPPSVQNIIEPMAKDGAAEALEQIDASAQTTTDLANERATQWARERSAELVGMKYGEDGELVDNPDAKWSITESTRTMVKDLVTKAIDEGWSNDRLAQEIGRDEAFSDDRAELIARTETAMADVQGNMVAYKAAADSGIELKKEWLTAEDDLVSDDCQLNADAGPIDLDDAFPSGASAPPEHPNCRCDVLPVRLARDEDADQGDESAD